MKRNTTFQLQAQFAALGITAPSLDPTDRHGADPSAIGRKPAAHTNAGWDPHDVWLERIHKPRGRFRPD